MSASSQRMRKSSPCSTAKQGPMRATLPVSSLLRQSRQQPPGSRKSNNSSPTVSPTNSAATATAAAGPGATGLPGAPTTAAAAAAAASTASAAASTTGTSTGTAPGVAAATGSAGASSSSSSGWRARISPEASSSSSGQRSPGSLSCKGYYAAKSKTLSARCSDSLSASQSIRRTASLDTIYLKGQWPRDSHYIHHTSLLVDKATQTDDCSSELRKSHSRHPTEQSITDEKLEKYFRHRLQRTNKEGSSSRERTAAFGLIMPGGPPPALPGDHSVLLPSIASQTSAFNQFSLSTKASPMNIPVKPMRPPMRSSIEGLNQEIEGLVLKSTNNPHDPDHQIEDKYARYRDQMTPEGHRAPLADLFRANRSVNSVNTQTPATDLPSSSYSSGGSRGSTPEQEREGRLGTSPHINRFLAREPPDGCEKVNTKFIEDVRRPMTDLSKLDYCSKPCVAFQLKPSLGSAFLPLQQISPTMVSSTSPSSHTAPTTPPPNP